jgi:hypothetical protein
LYNIVRQKADTLAMVMQNSPLEVTFKRDLVGPGLASWNALLQRLEMVQLSQDPMIEIRWNLKESGKFSVNSMYNAMIQSDTLVDDNNRRIGL